MREPRIIRADETRRVPWKNGRGITEEIAVGPAGATFEAGDFAWRVSRASVAEDGPFSPFPGIDRVLVVTSGAGLRLTHGPGAAAVDVAPLTPHRFSGDVATRAELVGGAVRDFNVLTRRGAARADVAVLRARVGVDGSDALIACGDADELLIHAVGGGEAVPATLRQGSRAWHLASGDTLRITAPSPEAVPGELHVAATGDAAAALLVVRIHLAAR